MVDQGYYMPNLYTNGLVRVAYIRLKGSRWESCNNLASHLWDQSSVPWPDLSGDNWYPVIIDSKGVLVVACCLSDSLQYKLKDGVLRPIQ